MDFTGSQYEGERVNGRMEGKAKVLYAFYSTPKSQPKTNLLPKQYTLANGTIFVGQMLDGMFHGEGTLYFPGKGRYEATWDHGKEIEGKYTFSDGLEYKEDDWEYCLEETDRRFFTEISDGIKPAGHSQFSNTIPTPEIPDGCYDTADGYYDPGDGLVHGYDGKVLRNPEQVELDFISQGKLRVGIE